MLFQNYDDPSLKYVPLTGLTRDMQIFVFGVLFPLIISLIVAIIFSRVFAPLFLKLKNKVLSKGYKDGFIAFEPKALSKGKLLKRGVYTLLLTMGFVSFIIPLLDVQQWIDGETYMVYTLERGIDPTYNFTLIISLMGMVFPLAAGLMAISWAIEDAGLVHYNFQDDGFYEIEPIHVKYSNYVNGYAGFSSVLFIIEIFMYHAQYYISDSIIVIAACLLILVLFFPMYVLFAKIMRGHSYLRKDLSEIKRLTEADLKT